MSGRATVSATGPALPHRNQSDRNAADTALRSAAHAGLEAQGELRGHIPGQQWSAVLCDEYAQTEQTIFAGANGQRTAIEGKRIAGGVGRADLWCEIETDF